MSQPAPDKKLSELTLEDVLEICLGPRPEESRWGRPGNALVARRLCALIVRRRRKDARVHGREQDLYAHVHEDIAKRLAHIWERYRSLPRRQTWSGFEAYLQKSIAYSLGKALERRPGRRETPGIRRDIAENGSQAAPDRQEERLDATTLGAEAYAALGPLERLAVEHLHLRGLDAPESARRLGVDRGALYKLRHRARRRFRNEVIQRLATDRLRILGTRPLFEAVVRERCMGGHRCFLYKIHCRLARDPEALAERIERAEPRQVSAALATLEREIAGALMDHELPPHLDECLWETTRGPLDRDHG